MAQVYNVTETFSNGRSILQKCLRHVAKTNSLHTRYDPSAWEQRVLYVSKTSQARCMTKFETSPTGFQNELSTCVNPPYYLPKTIPVHV